MPMPDSNPDSFHSDFISKNLDELVAFLGKCPEDSQISGNYFVVIDEQTKEEGTMLLCKREEKEALTYRQKIEDANLDVGNFDTVWSLSK